jgi:hypothetical protein
MKNVNNWFVQRKMNDNQTESLNVNKKKRPQSSTSSNASGVLQRKRRVLSENKSLKVINTDFSVP